MARIGYLLAEDVVSEGGVGDFAGRDIGAAAPTSIPDRATADGRYVQIGAAVQVGSFTVASLLAGTPSPATPAVAFCSNESGGAVLVFSDGTNWRRVTDRAIVS
jgi:hypothetical protein